MGRIQTRSATSRIKSVANWHPDSELIKGEITDTGMGVHLRWEYPEQDTSSDAAAAAGLAPVSAPISRVPTLPSLPSLSTSSSISSIEPPTLTMMSSDDDEGAIDSRPQTPELDDLYDPGPVAHTPTKYNRGLQRRITRAGTEPQVWGDSISGVEDLNDLQQELARQREREYEIHLEQMRKLQEWRRVKDQQWAEAEAAGVFEELEFFDEEEDQDDQEGNTDNEMEEGDDDDVAMGSSEVPEGSRTIIDRVATLKCLPLEPPSKLVPTLSKPQLPYMRTGNLSQSQSSSTSSTATHLWTISEGSSSSSTSSSSSHSASSSSVPLRSSRCVRRYQENGEWKTVGSWDNVPQFAHLAAYKSLESLGRAQTHIPELIQVCRQSRLDPAQEDKFTVTWPAALSRQSTVTDIDSASRQPKGLTTRPRHSI